MTKIVSKLRQLNQFDVLTMDEDLIKNGKATEWPRCDVLLCFSSTEFNCSKYCKRYIVFAP